MSQNDYRQSLEIDAEGYYFYAVIMAAMRLADSTNLEKLKAAFPETWAELQARHNSGGVLSNERK